MTTNDRNVSITIGTDNVVVSEAKAQPNIRRTFYTITNTSTNGAIINISYTDEAGAGKGIQLSPGGYVNEAEDAGFKVTRARISAISNLAGGTIAVSERIEVQ